MSANHQINQTPTRPVRLVAIQAGLSVPSSTRMLTDLLVRASARAVRESGAEVATEVIDVRDHAHAIADAMLTRFPSDELGAAIRSITEADGVIAATPIFNASYAGLFKSFMDVIDPQVFGGKPVLMGATAGTPRHSLALEHALRPLFSYLRADVTPTAVFAATDDFAAKAAGGALAERAERAGGELAAKAIRIAAADAPAYDEMTDFVDMGELLRR